MKHLLSRRHESVRTLQQILSGRHGQITSDHMEREEAAGNVEFEKDFAGRRRRGSARGA